MNLVSRQYVAANTARCLQPSRSVSARCAATTRSTHLMSPCAQLVSTGAAHGSAAFGGGCGGTAGTATDTGISATTAATNKTLSTIFPSHY
jgi:hypothetical protein